MNAIKKALREEGFDEVEVVGMVKDNKHKIKAVYIKDRNIPISMHQELLMFLFKTHESPIAWRYYCYTITFQEEN